LIKSAFVVCGHLESVKKFLQATKFKIKDIDTLCDNLYRLLKIRGTKISHFFNLQRYAKFQLEHLQNVHKNLVALIKLGNKNFLKIKDLTDFEQEIHDLSIILNWLQIYEITFDPK
jgi:hypothetical protein